MAPHSFSTDDNMWNKFGCFPPNIPTAFTFKGVSTLGLQPYQVNRTQVNDKTTYTVEKCLSKGETKGNQATIKFIWCGAGDPYATDANCHAR